MSAPLETVIDTIARALEERGARLGEKIGAATASENESHRNRLLEEHAEVSAEIARFTALRGEYPQAVTLRGFVSNSRSLDAATRQQLIGMLHDVNT